MADRINIGLGPRLGTAPTDTGGFEFVKQTALTEAEYGSRRVNFYNEFLGLPGLAEESGIDVSAPEVGADITPFQPQQQDSGDEDSPPPFLEGTLIQGTGESREVKFTGDVLAAGMTEYNSYSDYLKDVGKMDRVNLVSGIYEPAVKGNFQDMDFGVVGQEVQEVPGEVKKGVKEIAEKGISAEKAMQSGLSTFGGLPGAMIAGFIGGETVKNAFGNNSMRGSGVFGVMSDLVHAGQYQDMAEIRAAENAARTDIDFAAARPDTGFAMQIGSVMGLTRAPGAGAYRGNMQGMSFQQVKDLEAISKGYLPQTYMFDTSKKENIFGGKANVTIAESGGETVSGNIMDGFYTAEGKFYTPGFGYSAVGTKSAMDKFAATNASKYGISKEAAEKAIFDARDGSGTVAQNLRDAQAAALAESRQQREEEARRAEEARLAEAQRQAGLRRAAQPGRDSGGDDDGGSQASRDSYVESLSSGIESYGIAGLAAGGTVGMAAGGQMAAGMASGFVDRPPSQVSEEQTVADNVETQLPEGAFVINAAAVEFAGEQDIQKMLMDAQKEAVRRGIVLDKSDNSAKLIDVAISRGEVTVAPYLAKIIGYDRLTKINNRGKPEVAERQQEAAQGGMLDRPGYASGDMVTVYRGEPIDADKAESTIRYGYDDKNIGKFHTPSVQKARRYAVHGGPGNQQILSRKVTIDELFEGVEEAWKVNASKENEYFTKMPKKELDKNVRFIRDMKKAYQTGERSLESMVMFLQEQVFHDDKSKVNFIETFKNDPKSAGKLAGRAISKVATKATPPLAILEMIGTVFAPKTMGDATLQGNESFLDTNLSATR